MSVDHKDVVKIARLARIKVQEAEIAPLVQELNGILNWVEQLSAVDTAGVAPMTSVVHNSLPRRDDAVTDGGIPADVLSNAPHAEHGFFTVPKVVE
ncbi:Asp-tRNA(Asn)/Glu-tRNA(Gln) amidotransferase subunit GatC [Zavarzinia sp. CC-PAN008]|uniref:Asp-tRNA(Asn)/Glu-tRNA(Gln) amidotransferase subunit GatC n=1 Tax=Zavarzinia sp. CC-PAN008 TaxID=3243332 RepID=UPI003F744F76